MEDAGAGANGAGGGYEPLPADLYAGTSGIGMFLAELAVRDGEPDVARTAAGALKQALRGAADVPHPLRASLFMGCSGIAMAVLRGGFLLQSDELMTGACRLLRELGRSPPMPEEPDLLTGCAGGIVALLSLRGAGDDALLLGMATKLGERVLQCAVRSADGCSWPSAGAVKRPALTGFSHGAAGIGYALCELYQATGDMRYRQHAAGAFAYERGWYRANLRNWADRRAPDGGSNGRARWCTTAWCHGAPGIAVSRLRAFEILQDNRYLEEAREAVDTTARAVEAAMCGGTGNFSLCHGLAGNAQILAYAAAVLGDTRHRFHALREEVAAFGMRRYAHATGNWPCGSGRREVPGLMLGLAGIGAFYLHQSTGDTPNILIPGPRGFAWRSVPAEPGRQPAKRR